MRNQENQKKHGQILKFRHYALLTLLSALVFTSPTNAQAVYTFENLSVNHMLNGKDNWVDQIGQGIAVVYLDASTVNGTHVVRPLPTVAFNEVAYITRQNDSNFNFPQLMGNETKVVMQFDLTGDGVALFALGVDWNGDNRLNTSDGEIGPSFGASRQNFVVQTTNADSIFQEPFGPGNSRFDWYRMQLRIDLSANTGLGSGSLYYLNLSDGDVNYQPVTGLQNINLQLNTMNPNAAPQNWNTMWVELLTDGGNEPAIDNLLPAEINTVGSEDKLSIKSAFTVTSYPNPFQTSTTIKYYLPIESHVRLSVYDLRGIKLCELVNEINGSGIHEVMFNGTSFPGGYYYYGVETEYFSEYKKILRLKEF